MLKKANEFYRNKEYSCAKEIYEKVYLDLKMHSLIFNINLCNKKLKETPVNSKDMTTMFKMNNNINYYEVKHSHIFKQNFENISDGYIKGWIYNLQKTNKNDKVKLKLIIDDDFTIETSTFVDRLDIKKAFHIHCCSGYKVDIPLRFLDGKEYNLKVVAYENSKEYLIKETSFSETSPWVYEKKPSEKVVLFCTHNLRSQGAQNSLFELAIGLRRLYGITPVVYSPGRGPLEDKYTSHGIKVIIDNSFKVKSESRLIWENNVTSLSLKLKHLQCDLVIANTLITFYMIHGAKHIGIPSIFIPRESEPPKTYFNYLPSVAREEAYRTMQIASQVVFVADATRKPWSFLENYESFKVIHNSLNTSLLNQDSIISREEIRKSFNIKEDEIVLLSLGTVTPRKGQVDFVKSLPEVFKKSTKRIKAFIVGIDTNKGDDTEDYSKEIYELLESFPSEIRNNIVLIPETDKQKFTKPYEFYALADIYIFTSRIESFPRVMLEALYFGLPIVSTPCFGVVEQCIEGYNAFYYNEEDIKKLSKHTLTLVNDDQIRASFSKASQQLFAQLQTYDQMIENYYGIIEKITQGN